MNKIKATYEILSPMNEFSVMMAIKHIERIARVCYKSEGNITEDSIESAERLIRKLIESGHEAMIEHLSISVLFTVDRGVSHELVRHRLASFAQESTRYCNYSKDKFDNNITVIDLAPGIDEENKLTAIQKAQIINIWEDAMLKAEDAYLKMIEAGATPQIARSVLPQSTKTDIVVTANLREWRTIFKLRADQHAHPQMREVMIPLLNDFKEMIPIFFDDINPK